MIHKHEWPWGNQPLSRKTVTKRPHTTLIHLFEICKTGKSIKTVNECMARSGGCRENTATDHNGYRVCLMCDESILKLDCNDGCTTYEYAKTHWIVDIK